MIAKTKYRATIDPKFLTKVDRIFDASARTIFNELIQNARRAKASEVTINLESFENGTSKGAHVTFRDNGTGVESPMPLLRLAGSEWDEETQGIEDPAGMGFFSLSVFDEVEVASCGWSATFNPRIFCGEELLETSPINVDGMFIKWAWPGREAQKLLVSAEEAANYCGLDKVTINTIENGEVSEHNVTPKSYMDGCALVEEIEELGICIGIENGSPSYYGGIGSNQVKINFKGVIIADNFSSLPHINSITGLHKRVRIDVKEIKGLQLVLPARNAIKHNESRDKMLMHCERKIYESVAKSEYGEHAIPFAAYQRAKELFGIDIGEAKETLSYWNDWNESRDWVYRSYNANGGKRVIFDDKLSYRCLHPVFHEVSDQHVAFNARPSYEGYSWYDKIPVVTSIVTTIDGQVFKESSEFYVCGSTFTDEVEACQTEDNAKNHAMFWADKIKVDFHLSDGNVLTADPRYLAVGDYDASWFEGLLDEMRFFVTRCSKDDPSVAGDLAEMIIDIGFNPSDDGEADSADTQEEEFRKDANAFCLEFLGDSMDGLFWLLQEYANNVPWECTRGNYRASVVYDPDKKKTTSTLVEIETGKTLTDK